jgi:hypothetical protein
LATSAKPILPSQIVVITSATNRMIGTITPLPIDPLLRFFLLLEDVLIVGSKSTQLGLAVQAKYVQKNPLKHSKNA